MFFELIENIPELNVIGAELHYSGYFKAIAAIARTENTIKKMVFNMILSGAGSIHKRMIDQAIAL